MQTKLFDLGLIDFATVWDLQKSIHLKVKQGKMPSAIIVCQHKPVITIGKGSKKENILAKESELKELNIKTYSIERGGDVTYHGPGQLCAYPIVNLSYFKRNINYYLRTLEATILEVLSDFGINAKAIPGLTGVWIGQNKIASIGIAIKNWISLHGLSLNVKEADLVNFSLIRPCGMDIIMTSMEGILGKMVKINLVKETFIRRWYEKSNPA